MHTNTFCKYRKNYSHRLACILFTLETIVVLISVVGKQPRERHNENNNDNNTCILVFGNLKHSALIPSGLADFPHSDFDTISLILLAETAMFESWWTFCNFLEPQL